MVGVAIGAACRDRTIAFCSTFGAFLSRAYDQIRMGCVSFTNVNFVGTHVGVSIGKHQRTLKAESQDGSLYFRRTSYQAVVQSAKIKLTIRMIHEI